jgi:hypothetical protein
MDQASTCFKGLRSYPPTVSEAARPSWTSGPFSYFLSLAKISYLESMFSMLVLKIKGKGHISDNLLASEHWLVTKNKHWLAKKTMIFQSIYIYILYILNYIISYIIYHISYMIYYYMLFIYYIHTSSYVIYPQWYHRHQSMPGSEIQRGRSRGASRPNLQHVTWSNHGKTMGKVIFWGKIHMDCLLKIHGKTNNFWGFFFLGNWSFF